MPLMDDSHIITCARLSICSQVARGDATGRTPVANDVKMVYCTRVGGEPRVLTDDANECLVDMTTGFPKPIPQAPKATPAPRAATQAPAAAQQQGESVAELSNKLTALERSLDRHYTKLEQLVRPMAPTLFNVAVNFFRFSAL